MWGPVNATLWGKGLCKYDEGKALEVTVSSRLSRWALNAIASILVKRRQSKTRHTQRRQRCEGGGRDWRDEATSQGMLAATRNWKRHI